MRDYEFYATLMTLFCVTDTFKMGRFIRKELNEIKAHFESLASEKEQKG